MDQHLWECGHGKSRLWGRAERTSWLAFSAALALREAVCGAVYLHGLAADLQAELLTERALTPEDIISGLPGAFRQVGWDK